METKQIQIDMRPTEKDHIFVECQSIMVNRVEYSLTAHYFRWNDGNFYLGMEDQQDWKRKGNLYMSRKGDCSYPSESAKRKTIEILDKAVNKWVSESESLLLESEKKYLSHAIETRRKAIADMRLNIDKMTMEIRQLENGKHLPTYSEFSK